MAISQAVCARHRARTIEIDAIAIFAAAAGERDCRWVGQRGIQKGAGLRLGLGLRVSGIAGDSAHYRTGFRRRYRALSLRREADPKRERKEKRTAWSATAARRQRCNYHLGGIRPRNGAAAAYGIAASTSPSQPASSSRHTRDTRATRLREHTTVSHGTDDSQRAATARSRESKAAHSDRRPSDACCRGVAPPTTIAPHDVAARVRAAGRPWPGCSVDIDHI